MNGNRYSLTSVKQAVKYLLENCFLNVGSQIFCQVIVILMGSDISPFFVNLYLFYCESEWMGKMKNIDHHRARRFSHVYRLIDDQITVNDNKKNCK